MLQFSPLAQSGIIFSSLFTFRCEYTKNAEFSDKFVQKRRQLAGIKGNRTDGLLEVNVFCPVKRQSTGCFATFGSFLRPNSVSSEKPSARNNFLRANAMPPGYDPGENNQDRRRGSRGTSHPWLPPDSGIHPNQYADSHQRQLRL